MDVRILLKLMHEIFPVPTENKFKGTHAIYVDRESGKLGLMIWYFDGKHVNRRPIEVDNGVDLTREVLQNLKKTLDAGLAVEPHPTEKITITLGA